MSRFNVIWIDDEWQKSASFIDVCKEIHEIDITPFTTSKDGMNALEGNLYHWHGVILDAKVFNESENEIATLAGLQNSIKKIASLSSKRFIPSFISTGQPDLLSDDNFRHIANIFYKKGTDDAKLIADIIDAANKLPETNVQNRYKDVLSISNEIQVELMTLLLAIENGETKESNYLNSIRKILEWLRTKFRDADILPQDVTELNGFSKYICENIAPVSIQRSLHASIVISQEGSHRLTIDEEIRSGAAPYLLRSTTFELLNVLLWANRLLSDTAKLEQLKQTTLNKETISEEARGSLEENIIYDEGIVKEDSDGDLFCGECYLLPKHECLKGSFIKITKRVKNTNTKSMNKYKYFMHKYI